MGFDQAFEILIGHEGSYSNNQNDPGGETNWGISKRQYPNLDIRNLSLADAKELYRTKYWLAAGCDKVPATAAFQLFDFAVNSGVNRAIRTMQSAIGVAADGVIGPKTIAAIQAMSADRFNARLNAQRLAFMVSLDGWKDFSRGWALRIVDNLLLEE